MKYSIYLIAIYFCSVLSNTTTAQELKILNKYFSDMVFVPQQDRIYAVSGRYDSPNKSILYRINPYTTQIEDSTIIGTNIHKVAATDDGKYLYIAEFGSSVYRYDLTQKKVVLTIQLAGRSPEKAVQICVVPKNANRLVIANGFNDSYVNDIQLFEDDRLLAISDDPNRDLNTIVFGSNPEILYTFNARSTGGALRILKQNGSKMEVIRSYSDYLRYFTGYIKADEEGFLYTERGGFRVDIKNIYPSIDGQLKPVIEKDRWSSIPAHFQADPVSDIVYAVSSEYQSSTTSTNAYLSKYSKSNYLLLSKVVLPYRPSSNSFTKVIHWGSGKIAALNAKEILFIRDCSLSTTEVPSITQGTSINLCQDSSIILKASNGFSNYFWTNGDTGQIIKIKYTDSSPFSIAVAATKSEQSCLSILSKSIKIQPQYIPSKPYINTENGKIQISICQGDSIKATATHEIKGIDFVWSDGSKNTFNNIKSSGIFTVKAISTEGCLSPISEPISVTVKSDLSPSRPIITASGDSNLCSGESLRLTTVSGFAAYEWLNNNAISSEITVNPIQKTPYSVRVTTNAGCKSAWSESLSVQTLTKPDKPIITLNRNCMATQVLAEKYQWSWNNNIIRGATKQFHLAVERGKYTVKAYNGRCESIPSDAVSY
jgi:hypothetical protein